MNLKQKIRKVLREELDAYIRRRVDLSDENIKKILKQDIFFSPKMNDESEESFIKRTIINTTNELMMLMEQEEYDEYSDSIFKFIKDNYSDFILDFFYKTFKENEDATFCFIKHKERHGGNGFTKCFSSWFALLREHGSWLPDVNWIEVKEKLKTENRVLLARPLEGHVYEYYFSVLKK